MTRALRVLNVEDQERDVALLTRHLTRAGYEVISERVETPEAMRAALETEEWDVVLCDYSMPHFNALSALKLLQETGLDIPFIIISGTVGETLAVEAMKAGASDYLMKGNLARLAPTIEREMREAANRRARQQAEKQVRLQATALQAAANAIIITDNQGTISWVNPAFTSLTGYTREEVLGQSTRILKSGQHDAAFYRTLWETILSGRVWHGEIINQRKDGSLYFEEQTITPVLNETGEIINFIAIKQDVTEQKRADAELRRSEAQYRRLIDTTFEGVWIFDAELRTTYVNQRLAEMLGVKAEEMTGRSALDFVAEDSRANVQQRLQRRTQGVKEQYDVHLRRNDGSDLWAIVCATPILNEHGAFTGSLSMLTDITARKRVEEERARLNLQLESERQRMDNIVANVPGVVWEAWGEPDAATQRIDFVSDYVEQMLGYSVEEWLETPNFWLTIVHPDDREQAGRRTAEDFARGQSSGPLEFRWVAKDGRVVWVEANYVVVKDDNGQSIGLRGITTDISEQKEAKEALRQSEGRYRLLFERNPQPMWVFDLETLSFLEINDAAIHHYGYSREEFLTMTIKDIRPPEDVPNLLANLSGVTPQHEEAGIWKHRKKDGTIIDVEIAAHELTFYGRQAQLVLASDVTERRLLEEQFRQSQKMEAIGQLAGGIAHDFNNLLTAINGYSELAMRKLQAEDPLRRNLEEIKKAGERAASLTRQLLAFSRKQILQPAVLVINSVVSDMEKMLRRLIGEDIDLKTALETQLGSIKADPGQIEQIIMNLVINARDAMPAGGKLTIETSNVDLDETYARQHTGVTPGHYVMLAVSDTGMGMNTATLARIFEPFFTTKEKGKGTGLGLSTIYGIVKQSGGNIWVYSEVGQGTTFKVYLPRVDEDAQEYKRTDETEEILQGTETILLAEDEEIVRTLAREILETYGYRVLEASGSGAALLICERVTEPIDLLITDVVMPEMSGRQLAARLSQLRPEMKVLYMSGYTDDAIVHQGVLDEDANFIQKPFTPDALAKKVREVLNKSE